MKRITEIVMTNRANLALGLAGAFLLSTAAAQALPPPRPAKARAPAARPAAKPAVKPAVKPAAQAPDPGWLIETDCFEMRLPSNMVPMQRIKSASKPYQGVWGFVTAPNASLKVWVRCMPYKKGNFRQIFQRSIEKMSGWIGNWKPQDVSYDKDGEGRDIGTVVGVGFLKSLDPKTKKSVARRHLISRVYRQNPKRNLRVNITVAASDEYQTKLEQIVELLLKDFELVSLAEKSKIKQRVQTLKAKAKTKLKL